MHKLKLLAISTIMVSPILPTFLVSNYEYSSKLDNNELTRNTKFKSYRISFSDSLEIKKSLSSGGESKQTSWKHVANLGTKFEGKITKYELQKEESLVKIIGSQTMEHKNGIKISSSGPISFLRMVNQSESPLELEYELKDSMKTSEGWVSQETSYHISFKVDDNMDLWSWIWVYAGSWGLATYSKTFVKIDSVEFVI